MKPRLNPFVRSTALFGSIATLFTSYSAQAQTTYTNTTTGAQNWSTAANWGGTVAGGAGNTASITPASATTITLDQPVTIGTISAPSGNIANVITGTNTFTMNGTGGSNAWGIAGEAGISVGSNASGGSLTLQSGISIEMKSALGIGTTNGSPDLIIQGSIKNTSGGALNLNLRNYNTNNSAPSPNTVSGSIGATGDQINIQNLSSQGIFASGSTTTLSGQIGGSIGTGAVVTINNAAVSAGDFIISGNLGASVTTVTQNSAVTRMILSNASNAYTGQTTISSGVLQANDGTGLPTGSFISFDGGVLQSDNSVANFTRSLGASGASKFQFTANGGGFSANGGQLTVNIGGGSALQWGTTVGTNIMGNLRFGSTTANNKTLFQNAIDLNGASRNILVTAGTGGDSTEISGAISNSTGTAALNVIGNGRLWLSNAANTYTGSTTVSGGGTLILGSLGGTGRTVTVSTNSVIATSNALDNDFLGRIVQGTNAFVIGLGADSSNNLSLSGFSSASLAATSAATYSGTLTPHGTAYRVGGGSATLTLDTILANNVSATSLTKAGTDTVVLKGAHSYTGNTIVNGGTLSLTGSLNSTGSLVLGGGTFSLDNPAGSITQAVSGLAVNRGGSTVSNTIASNTLNLGAITRTASEYGTVNFAMTTGAINTTTGNNNSIIGPWATIGTGTSQRYAVGSPDGSTSTTITGLTGASAGTNLGSVTSSSTNYEYSATATTATASMAAYTLRYSGTASTTTISNGNTLTTNGLLNAGSGLLTVAIASSGTGVFSTPSSSEMVLNTGTQGITVSAPISGTGAVTKTGLGVLTLSNANSNYTGGLNVVQGTINFGVSSAAASGLINKGPTGTGTLTIGNSTTISWATAGVGIGANSIVLAGDATFTNAGQRLSIGGSFVLGSQTRTWTTPGSGSAARAAAMQNTGNLGIRFTQVTNGPALSVDSGNLRLVGSSPWAGIGFSSTVSFTGNSGLTLGNNILTSFSSTNQLGAGATAASLTVESGGYLNLSSGSASQSQTVNSLSGSGTVTNLSTTAGTATLTINNTSTFTGNIVDGSSLNAITGITALGKVAITNTAGTLTLSGTNTYTGATAVNGGTLTINGDNSGATGAVTVASASSNATAVRLKGTGTVGGATTFAADPDGPSNAAPGDPANNLQVGGIHSPGNSVGKQSFTNNVTYADGSIFEWEIDRTDTLENPYNAARGVDYDAVNVSGTLAGQDGADGNSTTDAIFRIVIGDADFSNSFWETDRTWSDIFTEADGTKAKTNWAGIFSGGFQYFYDNGTSLAAIPDATVAARGFFGFTGGSTLTWTAVPEPTSALAGLLMAAGLLRRRRVA